MKRLPYLIIINLFLGLICLAQIQKDGCFPKFEVKQTEKNFSQHIIQFELISEATDENYKCKVSWKVTDGKIIEGQDTKKILVLVETENKSEINLKLEADIKNLENGCQQTLTTEYYACILRPQHTLIDAYNSAGKEKQITGELKQMLENDPLATATIVLKDNKNIPKRLKELKVILDKQELPKNRVVFAITDKVDFDTEIWINPFSTELDVYKNAVFIKYENIEKIREILKSN